MEGTHLVQPAVAALVAAFVAARAYRRKSLDLSGALSGFLVMAVHIAAGYRYGAMLLVFFFSSSKLTKVGEEKKREVDSDFKEGGQRNWIQVLSNSAVATVLVAVICTLTRWKDECLDSRKSALITSLIGGVIARFYLDMFTLVYLSVDIGNKDSLCVVFESLAILDPKPDPTRPGPNFICEFNVFRVGSGNIKTRPDPTRLHPYLNMLNIFTISWCKNLNIHEKHDIRRT
ncbi:hypothetical protein ACJRO7_018459 [Eucalyptus globulus]|uniref:Uncharacterized protein n=1 Tax=Eucalyptus globulus TaxID=34317 RepID=A0ABD3KTT0_EUCGL